MKAPLATAAGVSLAAIGYHFGSKEALLNQARIQALEEWYAELARTLASDTDPDAIPLERFEAIWTRVIELFATHRPLWMVSFEMLAQVDHAPEVRKVVADAQQQARLGLASLFHHLDPTPDEGSAWAVGSFYLALLLAWERQQITGWEAERWSATSHPRLQHRAGPTLT